jgi:hypothetical protein
MHRQSQCGEAAAITAANDTWKATRCSGFAALLSVIKVVEMTPGSASFNGNYSWLGFNDNLWSLNHVRLVLSRLKS